MKICVIPLLFIGGLAQAADNLKFHGTLVMPPTCTISNDETIEVDFDAVLIDRIDGRNYLQEVPYTITCDSTVRDDAMSMTLTLTGAQSSFDTAAVNTNVSGLGVQFQQSGKPFVVGSTITINEQSKPVLKAVPVKQNGAELREQAFEAWATLQVGYL
ncbi:fimbrial protein [Salmonella enterica subsp. salamae]|nr:fimbrial protein [Salmonella enterica subsp. salamae]